MRNERQQRRAANGSAQGGALGPAEVGRALRNERLRQGLSHRDVSRRLGIPEDQLKMAESGRFGRTDQLSALKTVRRFADLLGLPGDRFALAILEQWPTTVRPGGQPPPYRHEPTASVPAVRGGAVPARRGGAVPAGRGGAVPAAPVNDITGMMPLGDFDPDFALFDDQFDTGERTDMVPAVPIATTGSVVHRGAMPWPLRAAAVVLVVAVVVGGALLAVDRLHPAWLRSIGLARSSTPSTAAGTRPTPGSPTGSRTHSSTGSGKGSGTLVTDTLRPRATSATAATLSAARSPVHVTVASVGGPCWVDITSPTSSSSLFSGVLSSGTHHSFTVTGSASIVLGSAAGRISATSGSAKLATYQPPVAPFTLSVQTGG